MPIFLYDDYTGHSYGCIHRTSALEVGQLIRDGDGSIFRVVTVEEDETEYGDPCLAAYLEEVELE